MENRTGKFIISLDFELHWGVFDSLKNPYYNNLRGARDAIKQMLELFEKYNISVTWGIVGMLFNENIEDYKKYKPIKQPNYHNQNLNPYNLYVGKNENEDPLHYAYDVIKLILSYPNQEVASHSYSHFYCKEEGQTIEEFEDDIRSAVLVAKNNFNIRLTSFIFPKNQVNDEYLKILIKYGFTHYRGVSDNWLYRNGHNISQIGRIVRFVDSFINISGYNIVKHKVDKGLVNCIGNRFLRPYMHNSFFNKLMLGRIKKEMGYAARKKINYHLWWHPHNFGKNTLENLENLENILQYFTYLNNKNSMQSVSMNKSFVNI